MLLVQSKPIRCYNSNNIFSVHFFHKWRHVTCALWRHLSSLPHQFLIFEDAGGWQPWDNEQWILKDYISLRMKII